MSLKKVVLNAVSAKMGGAANYLRTVLSELNRRELPFEVVVWVPSIQAEALRAMSPRFRIITRDFDNVPAWERLEFDQWTLRKFLRDEEADVLYSTANLGMTACPVRQVLLVRNAQYFSRLYLDKILPTKPLQTQAQEQARRALTSVSARSADVVMTPSQTMKDDMTAQLGDERGGKIVVNAYGVDAARFAPKEGNRPISNPARLLFTGLYGEHKNLTTLLTAVERVMRQGVPVRLVTTADPRKAEFVSPVQADDSGRVDALERQGLFESAGPISPELVARLYGQADVFVYPSLVESFGHPLLEAMSAGLPIVASDIPINRELCQGAALYFPPFDADACAAQIERLLESAPLRASLVQQGKTRARGFTWAAHVDRLLLSFEATSAP